MALAFHHQEPLVAAKCPNMNQLFKHVPIYAFKLPGSILLTAFACIRIQITSNTQTRPHGSMLNSQCEFDVFSRHPSETRGENP